jgi:hypothetical protein
MSVICDCEIIIDKDCPINSFEFNITDKFEDIEFNEKQKTLLPSKSELTKVLLCSDWYEQKYREIDFTGTTNEEAIKKILTFYNNKTYRLLVGDHTFFEMLVWTPDGMKIHLGS